MERYPIRRFVSSPCFPGHGSPLGWRCCRSVYSGDLTVPGHRGAYGCRPALDLCPAGTTPLPGWSSGGAARVAMEGTLAGDRRLCQVPFPGPRLTLMGGAAGVPCTAGPACLACRACLTPRTLRETAPPVNPPISHTEKPQVRAHVYTRQHRAQPGPQRNRCYTYAYPVAMPLRSATLVSTH